MKILSFNRLITITLLSLLTSWGNSPAHAAGLWFGDQSAVKGNQSRNVSSPDGQMEITVQQNKELCYTVKYGNTVAIEPSRLGLVFENREIGDGAQLISVSNPQEIKESYELKAGKQLKNVNHCMERTLTFKNKAGMAFDIQLRAYNDGVAFRYVLHTTDKKQHCIRAEQTEFAVPVNGKAWIHPYIVNENGKCSYEEWAKKEIGIREAAPQESGWYFPMLFNTNDLWMLITEAAMDGNYPATHVDNSGKGNAYKIRFPEKNESIYPDAPVALSSEKTWTTPWRTIIIGKELNDIFGTQMVASLNSATKQKDLSWIKAGRATWSWWSERKPKNYKRQVEFVNLAKELKWEYILLDEGWPDMQNGGSMEDIVDYAHRQGVESWLWYSSEAGKENDGNSHIMCDPKARRQEMERISKLGIRGIKVDFFDTDKQKAIQLCIGILEDAAQYKLMVNLHGVTLPRGWERTYPHLMTMEAVKGGENLGRQSNCDEAPSHNTVLPFTRNVVGSMDYTPVIFSTKRSKVPGIPRTTNAHQMGLSVAFESGFQCFADNESAYRVLPDPVKLFLSEVPCAWDESRLLAGYPGDYAVILRRKGNTWYLGGISGTDKARDITFTLPEECIGKTLTLIKDGSSRTEFAYETIKETSGKTTIKVLPNGGFCGVIRLGDKPEATTDWAVRSIKTVESHVLNMLDQVLKDEKLPRSEERGLQPPTDWTSGFYPGELWYLYEYTKDDFWLKSARSVTRFLEKEQYNEDDHDIGFRISCSYGNGYMLTGDPDYEKVIMQSAKSLSTRFNEKIGIIQSWNANDSRDWKCPVIIDNMMNLELLYQAAKLSGNTRFTDIALAHANTTLKNHFRKDYSCPHVVDYDPKSGKMRKADFNNGYSNPQKAAWSRGQAWALYGYTFMYRVTRDPLFLKQAEHIADYILNHSNMPKDMIPYWDYNSPKIPTKRDASAASINASALLELSTYSLKNARTYFEAAERTLKSLSSDTYLAKTGTNGNFAIKHATGNFLGGSELDNSLVYADYYFLEGLVRYLKLSHKQNLFQATK